MPRTLVNTESRHTRTRLFGTELPMPLVIAPTGVNAMLTSDADFKLAAAAAKAGIPFTLSTVANARPDAVARASGGRLWMQLYWFRDPAIAADVVRRAAEAEC